VSGDHAHLTPETLKVHSAVAMALRGTGHAAGYAVWTLARALDTDGRGWVDLAELRAFAARAGMASDRFKRGLRNARNAGLASKGRRLYLAGLLAVGRLYGLEGVGAQPVLVPADSVSSAANWKRALWAAFHAGRTTRKAAPVSRQTLRDLSGVSERTQRRYEADCRLNGRRVVRATPNLCRVSDDPSKQAGLLEYGNYGALRMIDGALYRQMPNTYQTCLELAARGMARRVSRELRNPVDQCATGNAKFTRYYDGQDAAERASRRVGQPDAPGIPSALQPDTPERDFMYPIGRAGQYATWAQAA
jgi:hypothetical protein